MAIPPNAHPKRSQATQVQPKQRRRKPVMTIEAMKQMVENICSAKLCEINSMSSRAEMLRLMDKAIETGRQAIAEAEKQKSVPLDNDPEKHPQFYTWTWDEWMRGGEWRAEYGWKKPERKVTNLKPLYTHPYVPTERQPKVEQEPVAMLNRCADEKLQIISDYDRNRSIWELSIGEPHKVYTHPQPKREWVGLTDQEILDTYRGPDGSDYVEYARGLEAKLKEKNT